MVYNHRLESEDLQRLKFGQTNLGKSIWKSFKLIKIAIALELSGQYGDSSIVLLRNTDLIELASSAMVGSPY